MLGGGIIIPYRHLRSWIKLIPFGQSFYVHQCTKKEFIDLFKAFSEVEVYCQRGVTIELPGAEVYYPLGASVCKNDHNLTNYIWS